MTKSFQNNEKLIFYYIKFQHTFIETEQNNSKEKCIWEKILASNNTDKVSI